MDKRRIAEVLETIAQLLELKDENPFKVRAYRNAARAIEGLTADVRTLVAGKKLGDVPGIGEALEQKLTQLVTTGRMDYLESLRKEVPAGVLELLKIPSLGPKKARTLWKEIGVTSIEELGKACAEDRLLKLKGFGEKTQQKILEGIDFVAKVRGQFLLSDAMPVARSLLAFLKDGPEVAEAGLAGSIRRWKEVVRDIDLLASSSKPERVMERFVKAEGVAEVIARGETKTSVRLVNGLQVDLRVVAPEQFPFALNYFTGSKEHNVAVRGLAQRQGLKLSEYGLFKGEKLLKCSDEQELYERLGLPFIPPELRENSGELDLHEIPQLVDYQSLKGVFHTHSTWSDGTGEIDAMAEKARSMGLEYMGLSDHSKAAAYANGLDEARLEKQMGEVDRLNAKWQNFRILKGLECDILPGGNLDLKPEILSRLDFVIGSVHSYFEMSEEDMTKRVCKALSSNDLDMLGHPTGRLLLSREGFSIDLDAVIETARKHGKILELNANPHRLDLDWIHARKAREKGVLLSINPDAHSTSGLEDIEYGIATARRAWVEEKDVLNTRGLDDVRKILKIR
jgi:DNA polymerase (family 10)